ncbi:hypothetical protein GCM10010277_87470 [Streptomyces longisporoflavus]|uniref:hypothetical protein n=1 Tax=Streptomyces longisporoflavus TaxID=28044 RepID=UPI001983D09F|nr:hypothetical protein [Streptomyces longisporoflavus]GGV73642.1 hypothetical protein GCM10010277_87470 [Streptomyces longisporoflavus]
MSTTLVRPAPEIVARRAREILAIVEADPEFDRLRTACAKYDEDWQSFTGYALVDGFDVAKDTGPLFPEAMRTMAIKSAVYEMTDQDEEAAEIPVAVPVDEMIHALAAQFTVLCRIQERTDIKFVHATDRESIGEWDHGDYTHQVYRAAWGPMNERYWLGKEETARRKTVVTAKYTPIGILDGGRRFAPGFPTADCKR